MANERGSLDFQAIHELKEVADQSPVRIISIRCIAGLTIATTRYGDDTVTMSQQWSEFIEDMGGTAQARQQNHDRPLASMIDVV